jgi:hypothetical protein
MRYKQPSAAGQQPLARCNQSACSVIVQCTFSKRGHHISGQSNIARIAHNSVAHNTNALSASSNTTSDVLFSSTRARQNSCFSPLQGGEVGGLPRVRAVQFVLECVVMIAPAEAGAIAHLAAQATNCLQPLVEPNLHNSSNLGYQYHRR